VCITTIKTDKQKHQLLQQQQQQQPTTALHCFQYKGSFQKINQTP
jgi:hypothetical protein